MRNSYTYKLYDSNTLEFIGEFTFDELLKFTGKAERTLYCYINQYLKGDRLNVCGYDIEKVPHQTYYAVYDKYDNILFSGDAEETAKYLGVTKKSLFSEISHMDINDKKYKNRRKIYTFIE